MTRTQQLRQAAHLWASPDDRDVAEIRLDDLLNPHADDAIVMIEEDGDSLLITQESGILTFIPA